MEVTPQLSLCLSKLFPPSAAAPVLNSYLFCASLDPQARFLCEKPRLPFHFNFAHLNLHPEHPSFPSSLFPLHGSAIFLSKGAHLYVQPPIFVARVPFLTPLFLPARRRAFGLFEPPAAGQDPPMVRILSCLKSYLHMCKLSSPAGHSHLTVRVPFIPQCAPSFLLPDYGNSISFSSMRLFMLRKTLRSSPVGPEANEGSCSPFI